MTEYEAKVKQYTDSMPLKKWVDVSTICRPINKYLFLDTLVKMIQRGEFKDYQMTLNEEITHIIKS